MSVEIEQELQDSARQVLSGLGTPAAEDKLWASIVELGWLLTLVPEDDGGLGLGVPAACAIYSELGRALGGAPYLPAMLAVDALVQSNAAERAALLESASAGEALSAPLATGSLHIAGGKIAGLASAVQSADKASHVLVWAANGEAVALAPLNAQGVSVVARPTWDQTRRLFDVRFDDVALSECVVLASGAEAQAMAEKLRMHRDFALASEAVGGANALLDMVVEYLQTRRQYGRPLALFQALKHRCADLKALITGAEALLLDSLAKLRDGGDPQAPLLAKMSKQLACAAYSKMAEEAVQLHGGIAMTEEYPCHLYLKRALLDAHLGAPAEAYEREIADAVLAAY